MKDRIPRWLHYCHEACCKKGGRHGRQALIVDKECTVEICFPDEWTWHMILSNVFSKRKSTTIKL